MKEDYKIFLATNDNWKGAIPFQFSGTLEEAKEEAKRLIEKQSESYLRTYKMKIRPEAKIYKTEYSRYVSDNDDELNSNYNKFSKTFEKDTLIARVS